MKPNIHSEMEWLESVYSNLVINPIEMTTDNISPPAAAFTLKMDFMMLSKIGSDLSTVDQEWMQANLCHFNSRINLLNNTNCLLITAKTFFRI